MGHEFVMNGNGNGNMNESAVVVRAIVAVVATVAVVE